MQKICYWRTFFASEGEDFAKEIFNQYRQTNTSFVTNHHKKAVNGRTSCIQNEGCFHLIKADDPQPFVYQITISCCLAICIIIQNLLAGR